MRVEPPATGDGVFLMGTAVATGCALATANGVATSRPGEAAATAVEVVVVVAALGVLGDAAECTLFEFEAEGVESATSGGMAV